MFNLTANLVEMDSTPGGYQLVNPYRTNKASTMDLVEMAKEIQKVSPVCLVV